MLLGDLSFEVGGGGGCAHFIGNRIVQSCTWVVLDDANLISSPAITQGRRGGELEDRIPALNKNRLDDGFATITRYGKSGIVFI